MSTRISALVLPALIFISAQLAEPGQVKVPRVGVVLHGREFYAVVEGLRDGLKELGLEEGKHLTMEIRDAKGDAKAVDEAARSLERDKVDLLYAVASSVTLRVKGATTETPIVFYAGGDPISLGLVDSFAKPGGRLTGVHSLVTDLTAKRLEILKDILPKLRRVMMFYDPGNRVSRAAATIGQDTARGLGIQFVERHVASIDELKTALQVLRHKEVDGLLIVSDAMVLSQAQLVIDTARAKRLPTMFHEGGPVAQRGSRQLRN